MEGKNCTWTKQPAKGSTESKSYILLWNVPETPSPPEQEKVALHWSD
jgi:hypothetical protein